MRVDLDVKLVPKSDELLRAIARVKEEIRVDVELASPAEFIPVPPGREERSPFVARAGKIAFRHFDRVAQALAKLEGGHDRDLADVRSMAEHGLADPADVRRTLERIEPELYRFPAIDAASFRRRVEDVLG